MDKRTRGCPQGRGTCHPMTIASLLSMQRIEMRRNKPWFEDGNILLVTKESPTGYRVHQGVLVRYSLISFDCNVSESQVGIVEAFRNIQSYA